MPIVNTTLERVRITSLLLYAGLFSSLLSQLRQVLSKQLDDTPCELDMMHWVSRGIFEAGGQTIVGSSSDPLVEQTSHPMERAFKRLMYV